MTKFKEIEQALLEIGCTQPNKMFPEKFSYEGYDFKVYSDSTLADIFKKLIRMGKTLKVWDIKHVLEVNS